MGKNKTAFRYIGGAAFAALALRSGIQWFSRLVDDFWIYNFIQFVMEVLPFALLAFGLFAGSKGLLVTGTGFGIVFQLVDCVQGWGLPISIPTYFLNLLLWPLAYALLFVSVLLQKQRSFFAFGAAGIRLVILLSPLFSGGHYSSVFTAILYCLLWIAGSISIGFAPLHKKEKTTHPKDVTSAPVDVTDEFLQLKSLLDRGILTEEEFAEQKVKLIAKVK